MNKSVIHKLSMVQTVLDTLNSNPGLISTSPALGAAIAQLQSKTNEVQAFMQNYSAGNEWRRVEKDKLLNMAVDETAALAKVLRAYARSVSDDNLYNRMKINKYDIRLGGINGTLLRMKGVMDEATAILPALANLAYDDMRFAALTQLYSSLDSKKGSPRNAIVDHKALGAEIKQALNEIDDILEFQLDTILLVLKPTNEAFYVKYKSARKIIHHGSKTGPKGSPPEPETNNA